MKYISCLIVISVLFTSCEKEEIKQITYRVNEAYTPVEINYLDKDGEISTVVFAFESIEDEWTYNFEAKPGDIFYASAMYSDSLSSVSIAVLIDDKVFREKYSEKEPRRYTTVSGTIP